MFQQFILLILCFGLFSCYNKETNGIRKKNKPIREGTFIAEEYKGENAGGTPIYYVYVIKVSKKRGDNFIVSYSEDGYQKMLRLRANLIIQGDEAYIVFQRWGDESILSYLDYKNGDKIMKLKFNKNGKLLVYYLKDEYKKTPTIFQREKAK